MDSGLVLFGVLSLVGLLLHGHGDMISKMIGNINKRDKITMRKKHICLLCQKPCHGNYCRTCWTSDKGGNLSKQQCRKRTKQNKTRRTPI
jgi:hypothetical protein